MEVDLIESGNIYICPIESIQPQKQSLSTSSPQYCLFCDAIFDGNHSVIITSGDNLTTRICLGCVHSFTRIVAEYDKSQTTSTPNTGETLIRQVPFTGTLPGECAACGEKATQGTVTALGKGPGKWDSFVHKKCTPLLIDSLEKAQTYVPDILSADV